LAQVNHIVDPAILEPEPTAIHAVSPFVVEVRLYVNVEIEDEYVVVTQKCCDRVVEQDVSVNVSPQSFWGVVVWREKERTLLQNSPTRPVEVPLMV
jgi:hypothetical protein